MCTNAGLKQLVRPRTCRIIPLINWTIWRHEVRQQRKMRLARNGVVDEVIHADFSITEDVKPLKTSDSPVTTEEMKVVISERGKVTNKIRPLNATIVVKRMYIKNSILQSDFAARGVLDAECLIP